MRALAFLACLTFATGCTAYGPCASYCADLGRLLDECDESARCFADPDHQAAYLYGEANQHSDLYDCAGDEYVGNCSAFWSAVYDYDEHLGEDVEADCVGFDVVLEYEQHGCEVVPSLMARFHPIG